MRRDWVTTTTSYLEDRRALLYVFAIIACALLGAVLMAAGLSKIALFVVAASYILVFCYVRKC